MWELLGRVALHWQFVCTLCDDIDFLQSVKPTFIFISTFTFKKYHDFKQSLIYLMKSMSTVYIGFIFLLSNSEVLRLSRFLHISLYYFYPHLYIDCFQHIQILFLGEDLYISMRITIIEVDFQYFFLSGLSVKSVSLI